MGWGPPSPCAAPCQEVLLKRAADLVEALYGMPHNNQVLRPHPTPCDPIPPHMAPSHPIEPHPTPYSPVPPHIAPSHPI